MRTPGRMAEALDFERLGETAEMLGSIDMLDGADHEIFLRLIDEVGRLAAHLSCWPVAGGRRDACEKIAVYALSLRLDP